MRIKRLSKHHIALLSVLIGLSAAFWLWQTRPATAQSQVRDAWQNVQRSDRYTFTADVEIETIPLPSAQTIGRFGKKDGLYLEGSNDRRNDALQLAVWGGAVSAADIGAAYQVRVQDGRAETRVGDEPWRDGASADIAFAPGGDFLSFLDFANDVTYLGEVREAGQALTGYGFTVNSRAYADHMRRITQQRLVAEGSLPPGVAMRMPRHLAEMDGRGELWVDARGLPVRQAVRMEMPAAEGKDYRTNATLNIYFHNYEGVNLAVNWQQPLRGAAFALSQIKLPSGMQIGANGVMLLAALSAVAILVRVRLNRRVLVVINSALLAVIVLSPLAQTRTAQAAVEKINAYHEKHNITPPNPLAAPQPQIDVASLFGPRQPRIDLATLNLALAQSPGDPDTDEDSLSNALEIAIGSNPFHWDSDGDGISDGDEVAGFLVGNTRWYGNPLAPDSNFDGVPDTAEWNPTQPDSDGDGIPDLYDWDDDNDGVPDAIDISRLGSNKDNAGNLVTFTNADPMLFTLDGVRPRSLAHVALQIRPTNPNQIWYAYNVLNWPKDQMGNFQDWDGASFFDYCRVTGGADCRYWPSANGDISIVPMLEVRLRNANNLPKLSSGLPDRTLLERYGIALQTTGNGDFLYYAPLNVVEEPATGNKVAFEAQLIFEGAATWTPQEVRLVWAINSLQDNYGDADEFQAAANAGPAQTIRNNRQTLIHTYAGEFHITGLNVREDRGVQMAIVYEDPATDNNLNDDGALIHLTQGLRHSYLINRDCDFTDNAGKCIGDGQRDITIPVIKRRWDRNSNAGITPGQRWGIEANRLRVETYTFRHEDEATVIAGSQHAPAILNNHFTGTAATMPTLLFVRESMFRALNLDGRSSQGSITWSGRNVRFDMSKEWLAVNAAFNTAGYKYDTGANGWLVATPREMVKENERRYPVGPVNNRNSDLVAITDLDQFALTVVTVVNTQGESGIVSYQQDSPTSVTSLGAGLTSLFVGRDLTDTKLLGLYQQTLSSASNQVLLAVRLHTSAEAGLVQLKSTFDKATRMVEIDGLNKFKYMVQSSNSTPPSGTPNVVKASKPSDPLTFDGPVQDFSKSETMVRSKMSQMLQMLAVGIAAATILFFTLSFVKGAQTAGEIGLAAVGAVSAVVSAISTVRDVMLTLKSAFKQAGVPFNLFNVFKVSYSMGSSASKFGAIGAAIAGVITWSLFFAAWGKSGVAADSMEFYNLLANAITSTMLIVINFVLALSVVGIILQAIIALFDLFVLIACKAGAKRACEVGIMQNLSAVMQATLYTSEVMIDTNNKDFPIVNIQKVNVQLSKPELGYAVGNAARFTFDIMTRVRHNEPKVSPVWHWGNFYTHEDIRSASVRYNIAFVEEEIKPGVNEMRSVWNVTQYGSVSKWAPIPLFTWIYSRKTKDLFQGIKNETVTSPAYSFSQAGINVQFPLYLNVGMGLPRYDCWWGFCASKSVSISNPQNLTERTVLDVLPRTLDEFALWSALGPQTDRDGDGLQSLVDPDDTKPDTDGDGLNDFTEVHWFGSDPRAADGDGDGLTDLEEKRYGTSPRVADSDGDGISDYDEIYGYNLTLLGRQVRATSDPLLPDSDGDGVSDGTERRLNGVSPVAYPFHPRAFNQSPVAVYVNTNDFDDVVGLGQTLTVTSTVRNNTRLQDNFLAQGSMGMTLPAQLGGATQSQNLALLPGVDASIVLSGAAISGQNSVAVTTTAAANLVPYTAQLPAPTADIDLQSLLPIKIDYDNPHPPTLLAGQFVQPNLTSIIGGGASDPTSYVSLVEVSPFGGGWFTATGTTLWSFPLNVPNVSYSVLLIDVRVTDAVGNQTNRNFSLTVDGEQPVSTVNVQPNSIHRVRRNAAGAWTLPLSGNAVDARSGLKDLTLRIGSSSEVRVSNSAFQSNGNWTFVYPFDDTSFNLNPAPTGVYTLTVTATDNALPLGNPRVLNIPLVIDMTPPKVALLSHDDGAQLITGDVITGTVADAHSTVTGVDYAFVAAGVAFKTERTLLNLPLNDLPQTVLFANPASTAARIFCLDDTCPTTNVPGADGTAAQFDGNDLLRNGQPFTLPSTGTTTALWFKTSCANCGLLSRLQGAYPDHTGHDFDLFLANGNVCVQFNNIGSIPEVRCTPDNHYANGQWHFLVHTVGTQNGNNLYVNGLPPVSSPTTAGPVNGINSIAVGYSPAAGAPFLTGFLDNVVIYDAELSAGAAANLYRAWQPATLHANGTWSFALPEGLEGYYQIDMRAADAAGNRSDNRGDWAQYRGPIDTSLPRFDVDVVYSGSGSAAQTEYSAAVTDQNLTRAEEGSAFGRGRTAQEVTYSFVCPPTSRKQRFATDPAYREFAGVEAVEALIGIDDRCLQNGFQSSLVSAYACDVFGHCGAAQPPQTVAYVGTTLNRLNPFGSLPNAIERVNLSDPANRVPLIERPGREILDIEVDLAGGKFYWAEGSPGVGRPFAGEIWRANLDGSDQQRLFGNLSANLHDQLQIAIDPVGNKIYWTAGYQLFWANLDGTQAAAVYSIPDDPRFVGGNRQYQTVGDVAVDELNRKLYITERRNRLRGQNSLSNHSLIVEMGLNGSNPAFVTGVRDGCTYANWNSNLGMGVGAGQQPDTCLDLDGGMDVESLTVAAGVLYWSSYAGVNSLLQVIAGGGTTVVTGPQDPAVWGKRPGQAPFRVAALPGLSNNQLGINSGPVPHLYANPLSAGVFAQYGTQIVRAEAGGAFTVFTTFLDETPAPVGATTRRSSTLTALAVVEMPAAVSTEADLRVELKSRNLVLIDGASGNLDMTVSNFSALPAPNTALTLTLPSGVAFAGANDLCSAVGGLVTCAFGTVEPFDAQSAVITFTLSTSTVRALTFEATVGSDAPEANPADNSAGFANITAAPTFSAVPGLPYLYYMLDTTQMVRVPLFGDYTPEPVLFEGRSDTIFTGASLPLASSGNGQTLYFFDPSVRLRAVAAHGGNGRVLADAYPTNTAGEGLGRNLSVAVHPTTGQIFYTEQASGVWSRIRRMNGDGSGAQTINERVLVARSLVVDPLRAKLYWIGSDDAFSRDLIYRSDLDGSAVEVVYTSPAGRPIRDLALDPYTQMLYWLDPQFEWGAVLRADADGRQISVISTYNGNGVRGLVVLPANDAVYYVDEWGTLYRNTLVGDNEESVAWFDPARNSAVSNLNPAELYWGRIGLPASNLVFAVAAPFPPAACDGADAHEPNNTPATAKPLGVGSTSGALCRSTLGASQDIDYFQIDVPAGKRLTATLRNQPADYDLEIRQGGGFVSQSRNNSTADESAVADNYGVTRTYTVIAYSSRSVNNVAPYTLELALGDAPPRTSFTNEECFAVDPNEATPQTGNGSQGSATPITIGQVITGALCFQFDADFYSFSGAAGQTVSAELLSHPTGSIYSVHYFRPNGSFFNAFSAANSTTPVRLDATGTWAVMVTQQPHQATLEPYTLLVRDRICGVADPWEPNDLPGRAAAINATRRVEATLCNPSDVDFYTLTAAAGQRLTISYPANNAGATLTITGPDGRPIDTFEGGRQRSYSLTQSGAYLIALRNGQLTTPDSPYIFYWQLDALPLNGDPFVIFGNFPTLVRVALTGDHARMPLLLDGHGAPTAQLFSAPTLGKLFFDDPDLLDSPIIGVDYSGFNPAPLPLPVNVNPEGVFKNSLVAVDELNGFVFWTQPTGNVISTSSNIWRANLDGSGTPVQLFNTTFSNARALALDPFNREIFVIADRIVFRRTYTGANPAMIYMAPQMNETPRDLAIDPFNRMLYWIDPVAGQLKRHALLSNVTTTLISGLESNARGVVVRPEANELYYSSGNDLFRARLDGATPTRFATLSGNYEGPSNLDPAAFPVHHFGPPTTNLVLGFGAPVIHPCTLADGFEPNDGAATATPTTVITTTAIDAALCYSTLGHTMPDQDYYAVQLDPGKILNATLSNLPADYRLVIIHPDGYAAAFSDLPGLADEFGSVRNTTDAPQTYHVVVLTGSFNMRNVQYRLTLERDNVPPPPPDLPPSDAQCALIDPFDAPAPGGNSTPATATPLTFGAAVLAALCYTADVDVYSFPGLVGQTVTIDLPTRPADYTLTLREPSGATFALIGATTTPGYGGSIVLSESGTWTVAVSHSDPSPTTAQYALLVTDENCIGSDANEPNGAANPTPIALGSRVRGSLCGGGDVDRFSFNAVAGQALTLNYPANGAGAALRLLTAAGANVATVNPGAQAVVTVAATGSYTLELTNSSLTARDVPYRFQLLPGAPAPAPSGSPYIYSGNVGYLTRAGVANGAAEPILLDNGGAGGHAVAADTQRNLVYVRTHGEQIARVDPGGRNYTVVIPDADPVNRYRLPSTLAVDEQTGRIYWSEPTGGVLSRILRADPDGGNVVEIVPQVVREQAIAVDPVGGYLYWAENIFWQNDVRDVIGRSNLDGSGAQTIYAAPSGREIRDLAIDPFGRKLYWIDPTQQSVLWLDADGGEPELLLALEAPGRGLIVWPLANTLYFSSDDRLLRADLDGGNVQEFARQSGPYTGVSNLDPGAFFPVTLGAPQTNLALAFGSPFGSPCAAIDVLEPNNTEETAAAITPGRFTAALCTSDLNAPDTADYYTLSVANGKQISVTLSNLPQDYALLLFATGGSVSEWNYNPGLGDKVVTHINRSGTTLQYLILVSRWIGSDSRLPYTLTVDVTDAPPPPPPPPPPADVCADVDPYDAPGLDGNWNRDNATPITYNTPITAALCYAADVDFYSWDGVRGQDVRLVLDPRPADYYVTVYGPDGRYVTGIFPGSWLGYGGTFTLGETGRWTLAVWSPSIAGTTEQYQLQLNSTPSDCAGRDPYEPNNDVFSNGTLILTRTLTLAEELCKADRGFSVNDLDGFRFPIQRGERIRITPRVVVPGVYLSVRPPGYGFFDMAHDQPLDFIANQDGEFLLLIGIAGFTDLGDNLPYVLEIAIQDAPPPPVRPANWTCTTVESGPLNVFIDDLTMVSSPPLTMPISGTVTYVALRDLTWTHDFPEDLTFGLQGPDGTATELFNLNDYSYYFWCGDDQCQLSLADDAQEGLTPPFPVTGGPYRPTRGNFSTFNGLSAQGDWLLLMADDGPAGSGGEGGGSTSGTLYGWELEVCIDNGLPAEPPAAPPDAEPPLPIDETPPGETGPVAGPGDVPTSCVAPNSDAYEPNNTPTTAVRPLELVSPDHTLHSRNDVDWFAFDLIAGRTYTVTVGDVGGGMDAGLAFYAADGASLIDMTRGDTLTFTADADATLYARVSWAGGLRTPCAAAYNLGIEVFDPTTAPPPAEPIGPPTPPNHTAPPLSAGVLAPADHSVLGGSGRALNNATAVEIGLAAENGVAAAALYANDDLVDVYTPVRRGEQDGDYDILWQTTWTPTTAGVYSLTVVITDTNGAVATSPAGLVFVDEGDPAVTLVEETVTQALLQAGALYFIHGTADDDALVKLVEVSIDGGPWQAAELLGALWQYAWPPVTATDPNGGSVAVAVRATDVAGNVTTASGVLTVDVVGLDPFDLAVTLTDGRPITATLPTGDLNARLTWPALPDADSLHVGWSNSPTPDLAALGSGAVTGGSRDQAHGEGSILYAHAIALDTLGNQTVVTRGPFYFDSPATPDLIGDLEFVDWPLSGGKQIGRQPGAPAGDQALFAGWNASSLRLRWSGFDVEGGGDVAFYLGTGGSGGATALLAPQPGAVLPFAADYTILVSSSLTATLYSAAGGAWTAVGPVALASAGSVHDVLIPWSALGVATPASSTALHLLAVATEQGGGPVWATIPDKNLGQATWNQFLYWPSLGAGVVPAAGIWADAQIGALISADPDPALPISAGDPITLTVVISNSGSAPLPSLTLDGSTTGGLALSNTPQSAADLAAGETITLTLTGSVALTGTVALTLADSFHRPYDLGALAYQVDDTPPVSVTVDLKFVSPFTTTIRASAQDTSALAAFEVEIDGPARRAPQTVSCLPGRAPGDFLCLWNPGGASDGETYQLRGRATDVHGNVSGWSSQVQALVDATPPVLTLSTETLAFLADGKLSGAELLLRGALSDLAGSLPGLPESIKVCADSPAQPCAEALVDPGGSWVLTAPTDGAEYTTTLTFIGRDAAGNLSAPITRTVWIDREAPRFAAVQVTPTVNDLLQPVTFATGVVEDGDAVAALRALLVGPDLTVTQVAGTLGNRGPAAPATGAWSVAHQFSLPGAYQVLFVATDAAGNSRALPGGTLTAGQPNAILLGSFTATAQPDGAVLVAWTTEAEWNHAGFLVYRSASADAWGTLLTPQLIPSQGLQGQGAGYSFRDTTVAPGVWFYTLVDVDVYGVQTAHGPVAATVGVPTAIGMDGVAVPTTGAWLALAAAGLLFATWAVVRRARRRG